MINKLEDYTYAGVKAGEARNAQDEARAKFETDWARRAINLETEPYRGQCRNAFDSAYKRARGIPQFTPFK